MRLEACGLCHTDIHAAGGDWPVKPTLPFVPGHEGVGIVEQVGADVTESPCRRTGGDRLARLGVRRLPLLHRRPRDLVRAQENSGYSVDGAFAEYAVASAAYVVPVPDGISSVDAAPLTCAGVTTYKAMKVARVAPTELVGVFGIGGLGHLAVQYAQIMGGSVVAVDIEQAKLDLARELGAAHCVNAGRTEPWRRCRLSVGWTSPSSSPPVPHVFEQAFASLRRGGRLVCVAMPADGGAMTVPIFETVVKGISIIGSIVGTRQDLVEVFALHAAGRTRVIAETRALEDVNTAMADVLSGQVPARLVFQYAAVSAESSRDAR